MNVQQSDGNFSSTWPEAYRNLVQRVSEYRSGNSSGDTASNHSDVAVPMASERRREAILDDARRIITGERNVSYGEPEDNLSRIAILWDAYLGNRKHGFLSGIGPEDVAIMMTLMKIARLQHDKTNYDSWLDAVGYMAVGWDAMNYGL